MKLWMQRKRQQKVVVTTDDDVVVEEEKKVLPRTRKFVKTVVVVAANKVKRFFVGLYQHFESVVLLLLASYGVNALLSLLPFMITLPLWIEFAMVIPFIAVCIVLILTKVAEWRGTRRMNKMVAFA
jgi:hypothetical protein